MVTPLTLCLCGLIFFRMFARSWTSWAFWIPVFLDRNFLSKSVVVIGLLFRYLLTASSDIASLPCMAAGAAAPNCSSLDFLAGASALGSSRFATIAFLFSALSTFSTSLVGVPDLELFVLPFFFIFPSSSSSEFPLLLLFFFFFFPVSSSSSSSSPPSPHPWWG